MNLYSPFEQSSKVSYTTIFYNFDIFSSLCLWEENQTIFFCSGPASASNRAHPQLPAPARPIRPNLGSGLGSPPPFSLANLPPAAQIAALNMAKNGQDLNLIGSAMLAAQGREWMRSPQALNLNPGQGSPNFRMPTSPMMLRPPGKMIRIVDLHVNVKLAWWE